MKEKNIIKLLVEEATVDGKRTHADIYKNMKDMSKANFYGYMDPNRVSSPTVFSRFRKGLGLTRTSFWRKVMDFYDPEN